MKISVKEFIENEDLMEITYTPYEGKLNIIDSIITESMKDGVVDYVILNIVSEHIFVESITNLDLDNVDDNGLKGYDQLYYYGVIEKIRELNEFKTFQNLLNLELKNIGA